MADESTTALTIEGRSLAVAAAAACRCSQCESRCAAKKGNLDSRFVLSHSIFSFFLWMQVGRGFEVWESWKTPTPKTRHNRRVRMRAAASPAPMACSGARGRFGCLRIQSLPLGGIRRCTSANAVTSGRNHVRVERVGVGTPFSFSFALGGGGSKASFASGRRRPGDGEGTHTTASLAATASAAAGEAAAARTVHPKPLNPKPLSPTPSNLKPSNRNL